ncbi:MAG: aspartate kinase [Candidatus Curtissbacteria bacterium]|nr:aspartate kinase [Candidatus Curtissbacteria bacterium]
MIVTKFGGTSLSTVSRVKTLREIIKGKLARKPIVVVSAVGGITDLLIAAFARNRNSTLREIRRVHKDLASDLFKGDELVDVCLYIDSKLAEIEKLLGRAGREKSDLDRVLATGEVISSYIVARFLKRSGIRAEQVVANDLIVTDNNFGAAEFLPGPTVTKVRKILKPLISGGVVPVVTGYIGSTKSGEITTLGRGGSDYSAAIIGFCLRASEIQIWTDVDGIFTADPKIVKRARVIAQVSFKEASELAAFGAKVLHPRSIRPAVKAGIPVRVLNTLNPKSAGTLILDKPDLKNPITAVSYKRKITLVNIYSTAMLFSKGFLARIFAVFANSNISIDLVSVSEVSVSVTLEDGEDLNKVTSKLSEFAQVTVNRNLGMVSLIGEGIVTSSLSIKKIFEILDRQRILVKMVSLGATDINVSLVVQYDQVEQAVRVLHNKLLVKKMNVGGKS